MLPHSLPFNRGPNIFKSNYSPVARKKDENEEGMVAGLDLFWRRRFRFRNFSDLSPQFLAQLLFYCFNCHSSE